MDKLDLIKLRAENTRSEFVINSVNDFIDNFEAMLTTTNNESILNFNCFPYSNNSIIIDWVTETKHIGIVFGRSEQSSGWFIKVKGSMFAEQPWGYIDTLDLNYLFKEISSKS